MWNMAAYTYEIWGHTDVGQARDHNEDALYFVEPSDKSVPQAGIEHNGLLMAVADGVGGAMGGEVASRAILDNLVKTFYTPRTERVPQHLVSSIDKANKLAHSEVDVPGASTTLVAAAIHKDRLHIAHVGDSRAYLIRDRTLHQLTDDHAFGNRLLRYLVSTEVVEADLHEPLALRANDRVLLCSDGFYREVTKPKRVLDILASNSAEEATYELIDLANRNGGHDNISVIVINVRQPRTIPKIYPSRWESV